MRRDDLQPAFKMMARISRIMAQLIQAWDVLSTMTPSDYQQFRDALGHSSGFQSYQYRATSPDNDLGAIIFEPVEHLVCTTEIVREHKIFSESMEVIERIKIFRTGIGISETFEVSGNAKHSADKNDISIV